MRNNPRIIKTLSAFTALASMIAPNYGYAQSKNPPAIELNLDVLEKLRHSEKPKQKAKAAPKKNSEKKLVSEKKKTKKATHSAKKNNAKKELVHKQNNAESSKKPLSVNPEVKQKPVVEIKKEVPHEASPESEEKIQNFPVIKAEPEAEKVEAKPEAIEVDEIPQEDSVPKKPAIEIIRDDEPEQTDRNNDIAKKKGVLGSFWPFTSKKQQSANEAKAPLVNSEENSNKEIPLVSKTEQTKKEFDEKSSAASIWNKIPFVSKSKSDNQALQNDTESAKKLTQEEEQEDIYDDKHVEEFITKNSSGVNPLPGSAVNNISSYTDREIDNQTTKEELRQARIKERREAAEQKIKDSKPQVTATEKGVKPLQVEKKSVSTPIDKQKENLTEKLQIVKPEIAKNSETLEKEEAKRQLSDMDVNEEAKEEEVIASSIKPTDENKAAQAEKPKEGIEEKNVKPEKSWQQFLAEAKRKAGNLESENMPKMADQHIINNNSVVALRPEDKKAKDEAIKPEQITQQKTAPETPKVSIASPAQKITPEKNPEESLKALQDNNPSAAPTAIEPLQNVQSSPNVKIEPKEKITTNAEVPAPVIKKQEKATLSSLMDKLPYFNENKTELKNDAVKQKADVVKKEPEIPLIHEVKSIPVELENEVKPAADNVKQEKNTEKMGVLAKMLDKDVVPSTKAPSGREVIISDNIDKKLDEAIDSKISAKDMNSAPPVPEIASIPAEIISSDLPKEADKNPSNKTANGNGIILSITFDANNIVLNDADKTRITDLVGQILNSNRRFKIVSYAQGLDGEINSSRRISLQRAIAVRSHMIHEGLEKNRINVQAAGNNISDQEFANSVNIYEVK